MVATPHHRLQLPAGGRRACAPPAELAILLQIWCNKVHRSTHVFSCPLAVSQVMLGLHKQGVVYPGLPDQLASLLASTIFFTSEEHLSAGTELRRVLVSCCQHTLNWLTPLAQHAHAMLLASVPLHKPPTKLASPAGIPS